MRYEYTDSPESTNVGEELTLKLSADMSEICEGVFLGGSGKADCLGRLLGADAGSGSLMACVAVHSECCWNCWSRSESLGAEVDRWTLIFHLHKLCNYSFSQQRGALRVALYV